MTSRPALILGSTRKIRSPLGNIYVTINELESAPLEVFATLGKAGTAERADAEAIGRLISLALRSGVKITRIHRELRGISCDQASGLGPNKVLSVPDAIAQAIEQWITEKGYETS
jgi:ribonucleoside-diphosphate reductase alpha chain